jgi:xylose isomerase
MAYEPNHSDKFTFGLWTLANPGRDPFGAPVRTGFTPVEMVKALAPTGAWGINFHDADLFNGQSFDEFTGTPAQHEALLKEFKKALDDNGMVVPMATTNLFSHPVFKDGAFTSNNAEVRAFALQKVMRSMEWGAFLGAKTYVFWGGREGAEVDAGKDAVEALKWMREALNFLCEYNTKMGYGYKFALEAKPNEPRGDIYLPTTGAMLGFIETLDHPEMIGVNPEVAHETMAGLNFYHAVAQALEAGKLFHIDLNGQKPGRFDQDLRFGQEDVRNAFLLVHLLESKGYNGPRHFDAHALRTADREDVLAFAKGCMRTYLILKEKSAQFDADPEIQACLAILKQENSALAELVKKRDFDAVKARKFDPEALAAKPLPYERLDQRFTEILLGV